MQPLSSSALNTDVREATPDEGRRAPSSLGALSCLALSMLMPALDTSIASVGLPTLARALGATFHQAQWIVLSYLLVITTVVVSAGRLGDLVGGRRLLQLGIALFTGASLLCGLASSLWLLVAARVAQGAGAAIMLSLTVALVGGAVPESRTGRAMGLLGTMSAVGTLLGPSLGGMLIAGFGWRALFLVNVPVGLVSLLLARRHLRPTLPGTTGGRVAFDHVGTLLLALTLAAYALAVTSGDGLHLPLLLVALAGGGLFVAAEARVSSPLVRLEAFRSRVLSTSLATNAVVAAVMMTTLVVGPFFLAGGLGLDAASVGLVMSVGPAISLLSGVPAGWVVDRLGAQRVVAVGLVQMAAGALALSALPASHGIAGYLAAIALLTPGYQLFQAANSTLALRDARPEERGVTAGLLTLSRNLGLVTGASAMGALFASSAEAADLTAASREAANAGLRITFTVAAGALAAAAGVAGLSGARRR